MSNTTYPFGTRIRFKVAFTNIVGVPVDPDDVWFSLQIYAQPKVVLKYSDGDVIKDSVGNYHVDYLPTAAGNGAYGWEGIGTVDASTKDTPITIAANLFVG